MLALFLSCLSFGPDRPQASKPNGDPVAQAKAIKSSPLYRDPGLKQEANWLSGAVDRLQNLKGPSCDCSPARVNPGAATGAGEALKYVLWALLVILLAAFVYFAASRFAWKRKLQRRAKALLDEDEPERSLDEWLERSSQLESEGRYREAVRCLYIACLLRIDEARIAKFERSETNWEHLARIEGSAALPAGLQFREPTKAFDEVWYGMRDHGREDVAKFRAWYREVTELTRGRAA